LFTAAGAVGAAIAGAEEKPPNVILIFADDLGYGDLGCYGSRIPTPNLDRMAQEGMRFTHFYSASPVCSPSRAALLTGRYPIRTGVTRVLMPSDTFGLNPSEVTIARMLKQRGYRTMCIGKWHLGSQPEFAPTNHGFDEYYGLPYSNDMRPLPLLRNNQIVEEVRDQATLTAKYTQQAAGFIERAKDQPFFLYLAHSMPHIPLAASEAFRDKSGLGPYGDAVMEMDWSVGQIVETLKLHGLDESTLVLFTSDNGPWYQGSAGALRGRKGSTYEGGIREPFIARMPGRIPAGTVCGGVASTIDILPTLAAVSGARLDVEPDGEDIWPLLTGEHMHLDRDVLLHFDGVQVQSAHWGPWKLHLSRYNSMPWTPDPPGGRRNLPLPRPELYDVVEDPGESYDLASQKADVVAGIRAKVEGLLLSLPDPVRAAWRETMQMRVQDTPAGALPREETY
jgi:arylsulfatase A-like enzyme